MKKKFLTVVLMLAMALCLCACGGNASDKDTQKDNTENSQQDDSQANNDSEEESEPQSEETGLAYTIKVVDEAGNPVGSVMVQLCKETCIPKMTDANGVAVFSVEELSDEYKASVTVAPEGYTYDGGDVYFEGGVTEVTLVLKAAQ